MFNTSTTIVLLQLWAIKAPFNTGLNGASPKLLFCVYFCLTSAPVERGPGLFPAPPGGGRAQSRGGGLRPPPHRLSKKWLAPLFRGVHSSLAPTARPGSYARKPLLRKAFCGFDAHLPGGLLLSLRDNSPCVAKSDQSLRGGKAERRQWREERGGSPVSKGAPGRPHGPTQRDLCELHCGPRTPGGFSTGWGGGLRPPPLLWFCRPAGPAKHRRPPRRPSFLRRQGALPAPLFAAASLLPANRPGKDGCPPLGRPARSMFPIPQARPARFFPVGIPQGRK